MKAQARLRFLGVPSLKVRRFSSTIKGEPIDRAVAILELQSSPTCQALLKLLKSAVANAEHNYQLDPDNLYVSNVMVDQGPTMKRIKPRARGRAFRIFKRSSHVTIQLDLKPGVVAEAVEEPTKTVAAKGKKSRSKSEEKE